MTTDIPLGVEDYYRKSAGNPSIPLRNVYYEEDPTSLSTQSTFIRRPGIKKLMTVGAGPVRKIYYRPDVFNNAFFVVSGTVLYRVVRTGPEAFSSSRLSAALAADTSVDMTASGTTLFVTDETALYYTDGLTALSTIATPDDVDIAKLSYVSGYILCVVKDAQRFYWIQPGETTIDPLDFAEAEGLPDGIVDLIVLGDQIYFFGKETVEVWYLTGDAAAPFQRISGKLASVGAVEDTACAVQGSDTFFFIAADGTARMGTGLQRISNPGIEERLRRALAEKNETAA